MGKLLIIIVMVQDEIITLGKYESTYRITSGGMHNPAFSGDFKKSFYNSLRSYDNTSSPIMNRRSLSPKSKRDIAMRSNNGFSRRNFNEMNKLTRYLENMDKRLSMPKNPKIKISSRSNSPFAKS